MTIIEVNTVSDGIVIQWSDGFSSKFHAIWLRDNCRCEQCGEPSVGRRTLRLSDLDLGVSIEQVTLASDGSNSQLEISWSDNHQANFSTQWLREHCYDNTARNQRAFKPELWNSQFREHPPAMDFQEVMNTEENFFKFLCTVRDHGICLVKNAPAKPGAAEQLASKIGSIQESNYGRVLNLVVDHSQSSIANDVNALKPHNDEPYRTSPPGLILFHCIETDISGAGSSIFLDGFEAAETVRKHDPEGFDALRKNNLIYRRYFTGDVDLITEFPVIATDEFDNLAGVRINDRVAAAPCIDPDQVPVFYRGMKYLLQLVEDETRMIKHRMLPGDIVVFDNHRILHGRTALTLEGRRWLQSVQVERGDFHSTLRILADKLGHKRDALPLLRGAYS